MVKRQNGFSAVLGAGVAKAPDYVVAVQVPQKHTIKGAMNFQFKNHMNRNKCISISNECSWVHLMKWPSLCSQLWKKNILHLVSYFGIMKEIFSQNSVGWWSDDVAEACGFIFRLQVGSPVQTFKLQIDTGSSDMAIITVGCESSTKSGTKCASLSYVSNMSTKWLFIYFFQQKEKKNIWKQKKHITKKLFLYFFFWLCYFSFFPF